NRHWRRLCNEGKRAIRIDRDNNRNQQALLCLCPGIKRLTEFHNVDPSLTESGANRGTWRRLSAWNLQFHLSDNFLRHILWPYAFSTCPRSSSTGVARPKILINTRSFPFSGFTSSTTPVKS